ncbi:MAG: response regulator [Deltaproteobacteria bacterium]|nr:response regulator [Deltaproteobacteria bacterium]
MAGEKTKKILVTDDDGAIRYLCSVVLSEAGYWVDVALDGMEALEMLNASEYDLVITDVNMPRLDGISLYNRAVRNNPGLKNSFLFMTGDRSNSIWFEANGLNKNFLFKPFKVTDLLGLVGTFLPSSLKGGKKETDKRQEGRFNTLFEGKILIEDIVNHNLLLGKARDLSRHGLKIRCEEGLLCQGSEISLCMNFNYLCLIRNARVMWSQENDGQGSIAGLSLLAPISELSVMSAMEALELRA